MEYTTLGNTGLEVSKLCLGTWRFGKESGGTVETSRGEAHELLSAFAERGGTFIDTANVYGGGDSERWIGEWLEGRDREDYVLASKVYWTRKPRPAESLSRKTIRAEIEGTLDRLGTEYLDLYYIHRWDEETPIEETMRELSRLVEEGKVNHLGASSMAAWQLTKALWTSDVEGLERFEVTQPRYNPAYRGPEEGGYDIDVGAYVDLCEDQGIAVCPYSPLEGGFLTGKYGREEIPEGTRGDGSDRFADRYLTEDNFETLSVVREVADETGATPAQVSLAWLCHHPMVTAPIVGARTVEQLEENLAAADVALSDDQFERLAAARPGAEE